VKYLLPYLRDAIHVTPSGIKRTIHYWMETETHVYAFAIAANVLLSFYPFLLVIASLFRFVLKWPAGVAVIQLAIRDFFAGRTGDFLAYNLQAAFQSGEHAAFEWRSVLLLLFAANGVFLPLEVALNRAWSVKANRSFLMNQVVSTGMIFGCGGLVLLSCIVSAANAELFNLILGTWPSVAGTFLLAAMKITSLPFSIGAIWLIYWRLPNRVINPRHLIPSAIRVGLALEAAKWLSIWITPWMLAKFERETIIFQHSLTILAWSFLAGMILLAGAQGSAWRARALEEQELTAARDSAIDTKLAATDPPTR
jgi:membrane protein